VFRHWLGVLLVAIGIAFTVFYLQSVFRWWYEDDTIHYDYVARIENPIGIFTDPRILRGFSKTFVPMQALSFWIDVRLFGFNPMLAHVHSVSSLLVTLVMLYAVLLRWTESRVTAMGGALLWLLLPSTVAVHQFIATRHYVEGLFFGLAACYFTQELCSEGRKRSIPLLLLIGLFSIVAMLFKEIYMAVMTTFLLGLGIGRRSWPLAILSVVMALCYAVYRVWMVGMDITYDMPFVGVGEYLRFLLILPYTFSASSGGYLIYLGIGALTVALVKRFGLAGIKGVLLVLLVVGAALVSLYPVTYAVLLSYATPGTWYRAPFIVNTILVICGVYALARILPTRSRIAVLVVAALIIFHGTHRTRQHWNGRMARAEAEGRFYLENPDKLLYSEEDAYWFIVGVHRMYDVPREHYINKQYRIGDHARSMVATYATIWRYLDGHFMQDDELYRAIQQPNMRQPLLKSLRQ